MVTLLQKLRSLAVRLNGGGPEAEYNRLHPRDFAGILAPVSQ